MGAIYMVLTFSIMVPMALLTDAIINYLSAELQSSDADLQAGVQTALVHSLLSKSCNDLVKEPRFIEEVLEGGAEPAQQDFEGQDPRGDDKDVRVRYFISELQPDRPESEQPAYVMRGFTDDKVAFTDLIPPPDNVGKSPPKRPCDSSYKPPVFTRYEICPVKTKSMVNVDSKDWSWEWLEDTEEFDPDPKRDHVYCPDGLLLTSK